MIGQYTTSQTALIATLATTITVILSTILWKKWKSDKIPTKWKQVGTIKTLYLYPLKSGHSIKLERAECTEKGLKQVKEDEKVLQLQDRSLIVYGEKDREFRTARTYPKMVNMNVSVHDENHVAIDAPSMRTLYVKIPNRTENKTTAVKCWHGEEIFAIDCGDEAATWVSRYIVEKETGLRLGYNDLSKKRKIQGNNQYKDVLDFYKKLGDRDTGVYTDLSSLHIINQSSVNDLNKKIGSSTVPAENFRPNIIVDGPNLEAFAEDKWDWVSIGQEVILRNVKDCTRCVMTTIDQETGVRDAQREPLKTLNTYRMLPGPEKSPVMGINLGVRKTGSLKVGDPVFVSVSNE